MQGDEREVQFSAGISEERRRSLTDFIAELNDHTCAIQTAARDRLARQTEEGGGSGTGEMRICINVGPDGEAEGRGAGTRRIDSGTSCASVSVPCGKSQSGYIYCTITFCEIVGPITAAP